MKYTVLNFLIFCAMNSLMGMEFHYQNTVYPVDEQLREEAAHKFKKRRDRSKSSVQGSNRKKTLHSHAFSGGKKIDLLTDDDNIISGYYIDRGKKRVLLIGQGFPDSYDTLAAFPTLFPDYDILMIEYRWSRYEWSQLISLIYKPFARYIYDCTKDVVAAVNYLKNQNKYSSITGIGMCYSALVYVMAQAEYKKSSSENELLFDSLILDSSYYSTSALAKNGLKAPRASSKKKKEKAPLCVPQLLYPLSDALMVFSNRSDNFKNFSMHNYLPLVADTPIMFIHGTKDLVVPSVYLNKMLNSAKTNKWCALLTENEHVLNHIKSQEMYSYLGNLFIKNANHLHIVCGYLAHKYEKENKFTLSEKLMENVWSRVGEQKARL